MDGFKASVAEFYGTQGHFPTSIGAAGSSVEGTTSGKYGSISIASGGGQSANPFIMAYTLSQGRAANKVLALGTSDGSGWACGKAITGGSAAAQTAAQTATTVDNKWLPSGCKP
ncbi:MAG: pilin [Sulfuricella sp.]